MKKMFVFDEISARRNLSDWGREVKRRLLERNMQQNDVVRALNEHGFSMGKMQLTNLLRGGGAGVRRKEIRFINELLGIPYKE
jgi:hypothetical protein